MSDIPFEIDLADSSPTRKEDGEQKARESTGEKVWTVSLLTRHIRRLVEGALSHVVVEGEVSNLRQAASGHLYFNLKDHAAQLRCVMFRQVAEQLRFAIADGLQLALRGRISVYEARGEYQLQVLFAEPQGLGAFQLAFEQLKEKLASEGLFSEEAKQPLPFLPRRIGMVTSPQGAVIQDMLQVLSRRFPGMPVLICPAQVQGDKAAAEIAAGIALLNEQAAAQKIDVIIVGRGGGSVEDLWAFNKEEVARAIHASRIPVISAVGHEVDFTIADFVADLRAPTPSAAAELAVPERAALQAELDDLRRRLLGQLRASLRFSQERWLGWRGRLISPEEAVTQLAQRLDDEHERLSQGARRSLAASQQHWQMAALRLKTVRPDRFQHFQQSLIDGLASRLRPALREHLSRLRVQLETQSELLDSLSPLAVLRRGYGLVQDDGGKPVRSVQQVRQGAELKVRLHDGTLTTAVRDIGGV